MPVRSSPIPKGGIHPRDNVTPRTAFRRASDTLQRPDGVGRCYLMERCLRSEITQAHVRATGRGKGRATPSHLVCLVVWRALVAVSTRRPRIRIAARRDFLEQPWILGNTLRKCDDFPWYRMAVLTSCRPTSTVPTTLTPLIHVDQSSPRLLLGLRRCYSLYVAGGQCCLGLTCEA